MSILARIKSVLPVSSRSAHAMHREIGEMHAELRELDYKRQCFDERVMLLLWESLRDEGESALDAKKRVFKNMSPATGYRRLYQEACIKLLASLDAICKENELSYWLAQGSLLGALRHGGFIPWDDDLDVGMTRTDAYRLYELLKGNSEYRVTHRFDFCECCRQLRFSFADDTIPCFIDIFLFDPVVSCEDATLAQRESFREELVEALSQLEDLDYWSEEKQFVDAGTPLAADIERIFNAKVDVLYTSGFCTETLDEVAGFIWSIDNVNSGVPNHEWYLIPKALFLPLGSISFEGMEVPAPAQAELYLENYLGDIYALPEDLHPYYDHMLGSASKAEVSRVLLKLLGKGQE